MPPKSRTTRASLLSFDDANPSVTSSPDPLGNSILDNGDNGSALSKTATKSSPIKRQRGSVVGGQTVQFEDIILATQTKKNARYPSPVRSGGNGQRDASPWRIRVTVEAEPEYASEGEEGRQTKTRTSKVLLKEAEEELGTGGRVANSSPVKKAPGRQRSLAPVRERGRGRRRSVTDLDITVLGDEDGDEGTKRKKKPRGRPRKSVTRESELEREATQSKPVREQSISEKNETDFEIAVDEDIPSELQAASYQQQTAHNSMNNLREIDLNRVAIRPRTHNGPKSTQSGSPLSAPDEKNAIPSLARQASLSVSTDYPTPEPSAEGEDSPSEDEIISYPDPTDYHEEFDTIMESEGFTMISLDTLSSTRQLCSPRLRDQGTPGDLSVPENRNESPFPAQAAATPQQPPSSARFKLSAGRSLALPCHLRSNNDDNSDISSTVPTPPPSAFTLATTPNPLINIYSSPKLASPPLPKPTSLSTSKSTPPRLSRVVRAGIALQGVLSPPRQKQAPSPGRSVVQRRLRSPLVPSSTTKIETPSETSRRVVGGGEGKARERLDDLFGGFDSGMRRELRAGLRFGEELARRTEVKKSYPEEYEGRKLTQVDGVEAESSISSPSLVNQKREREREWQVEREAVSRRIRDARPQDVVTIDNDDDIDDGDGEVATDSAVAAGSASAEPDDVDDDDDAEVEGEDTDIWLSEADKSSSILQSSPPPPPPQQQPKPKELPLYSRRRSAIPSPWKRGEDLDRSSLTGISGMGGEKAEISGLFWTQNRPAVKSKRGSTVSSAAGLRSDSSGETKKKFDVQEIFRRRTRELVDESGIVMEDEGIRGGMVDNGDEDVGRSVSDNSDNEEGNGEDIYVSDDVDNDETRDETEGEDVLSDVAEKADDRGEEAGEEQVTIEAETETVEAFLIDDHYNDNSKQIAQLKKTRPSSSSSQTTSQTPTSTSASTLLSTLSRQNETSTLSPSIPLPSSPPSAALPLPPPPLPQKIPVNFGDESSLSLLSTAPTSASVLEPRTPILKKSGSALELRGRSVEKGKNLKKSRVSFSPVVDTRCFEVVSPMSVSSAEGEGPENSLLEPVNEAANGGEGDSIEFEDDEGEGEEIELERPPTRHGPITTKLTGTSREMEKENGNTSFSTTSSSSWFGRLGSWLGNGTSSSASSPSFSINDPPPSSIATTTTKAGCDSDPEEDFTNDHHRFLLCLYLQSLGLDPRPYRTKIPATEQSAVTPRPSIVVLVGRAKYKYTTKEGKERKKHEWILDADAAKILEKWYHTVETVEGTEKWRGRERDLGRRLFSLIVGMEQREKEKIN